MEQWPAEYGIDLPWLILTIILCGVFLVMGYRLGYRQRREEEREAIEKSRGLGVQGSRGPVGEGYEGKLREERKRQAAEREAMPLETIWPAKRRDTMAEELGLGTLSAGADSPEFRIQKPECRVGGERKGNG